MCCFVHVIDNPKTLLSGRSNELNAKASQKAREEEEDEDDDEEDRPASAPHRMFYWNSGAAVLTDFQLRNCTRTTKSVPRFMIVLLNR